MKHLTDKLDTWWFIGILLLEMHDQAKSPIFEWRIGRTNNDSVPAVDT